MLEPEPKPPSEDKQPEKHIAPVPGNQVAPAVLPLNLPPAESWTGPFKGANIQIEQSRSFSGPIPPPEILTGYGTVNETFPERIMRMAEKEGDHRRLMEKKAIEADTLHSRKEDAQVDRAQWFGLVTVLSLIAAGVVIGGWPGVLLGGSGLAGVIGAFFYTRNQERPSPPPPPSLPKPPAAE